jgi:hypothetical protein
MDSSVDWSDMYNTDIKHSALYNGTRNFTLEHLQTKMAVDTLLNISKVFVVFCIFLNRATDIITKIFPTNPRIRVIE